MNPIGPRGIYLGSVRLDLGRDAHERARPQTEESELAPSRGVLGRHRWQRDLRPRGVPHLLPRYRCRQAVRLDHTYRMLRRTRCHQPTRRRPGGPSRRHCARTGRRSQCRDLDSHRASHLPIASPLTSLHGRPALLIGRQT
jgi:hypothetical protein